VAEALRALEWAGALTRQLGLPRPDQEDSKPLQAPAVDAASPLELANTRLAVTFAAKEAAM
jgi:hypothetical protein